MDQKMLDIYAAAFAHAMHTGDHKFAAVILVTVVDLSTTDLDPLVPTIEAMLRASARPPGYRPTPKADRA